MNKQKLTARVAKKYRQTCHRPHNLPAIRYCIGNLTCSTHLWESFSGAFIDINLPM